MIMAGQDPEGGLPVAGIITISKGHDASYPWKQIGAAEPDTTSGRARTAAEYYLSPAEKGGELPGIWTGRGVAELGLRPGAGAPLVGTGPRQRGQRPRTARAPRDRRRAPHPGCRARRPGQRATRRGTSQCRAADRPTD